MPSPKLLLLLISLVLAGISEPLVDFSAVQAAVQLHHQSLFAPVEGEKEKEDQAVAVAAADDDDEIIICCCCK